MSDRLAALRPPPITNPPTRARRTIGAAAVIPWLSAACARHKR